MRTKKITIGKVKCSLDSYGRLVLETPQAMRGEQLMKWLASNKAAAINQLSIKKHIVTIKLKPVEKDKDENITINPIADSANYDWLYILHLLKRAVAGDEKAMKEFNGLRKKNLKSIHDLLYLIAAPRCFQRHCKYYRGIAPPEGTEITERPVCKAYPNGIPDEIAYGNDLHLTVRKDQDNDITFKYR